MKQATTAAWIPGNALPLPVPQPPLGRSIQLETASAGPRVALGAEWGAGLRRGLKALLWLAALLVLAVVAWQVARGRVFELGDDFSYWLGVAGGSLMLGQYGYSVRKHFSFARRWGPMRAWLLVHIACGVGGPMLILFHSTFSVHSLNGLVAFSCMLVVMGSGILGRYVYLRVHHGLSGRRASLKEMHAELDASSDKVQPILAFAPEVAERLKVFHDKAFDRSGHRLGRALRFVLLARRGRAEARQTKLALKSVVKRTAREQRWSREQVFHHWKMSCRQIDAYIEAVRSAAQFGAYERIFRLWHVLHIPLLYLLFISSVVHVVAVHMY